MVATADALNKKPPKEKINAKLGESEGLRTDRWKKLKKRLSETRGSYEQGSATAMQVLEQDISTRRNAQSSMGAKLEMQNARLSEIDKRENELAGGVKQLGANRRHELGRKSSMLEAKLAVDQQGAIGAGTTRLKTAKTRAGLGRR